MHCPQVKVFAAVREWDPLGNRFAATSRVAGYAAALRVPEGADWAALLSEAKRQISVHSTIEAGDDALIERSGHRVEAPPGPVVTTTRACKGGRIIDSPISIIGGAPTQQAPPTQPARSPDSVSLELAMSQDGAGYSATARVSRPDSQADISSPHHALALDEVALRALSLDAEAYGATLSAGPVLHVTAARHIDRAVTEARAAVRDSPDWWAPVLFTRLLGILGSHAPGAYHQRLANQAT